MTVIPEKRIQRRAGAIAALFVVISAALIRHAARSHSDEARQGPQAVQAGLAVWKSGNCIACHAVYGLGGNLGPDLTNVVSRRGLAPVGALVRAGGRGMPAFDLDAKAASNLLAYLDYIDRTGVYPPQRLSFSPFGEIHRGQGYEK